MQAADSPFFHGIGVVDLGDWFLQPNCLEFFGAIEPTEKAPRILNELPLHNKEPRKGGRMEVKPAILFYFQIFHLALPSVHILLR